MNNGGDSLNQHHSLHLQMMECDKDTLEYWKKDILRCHEHSPNFLAKKAHQCYGMLREEPVGCLTLLECQDCYFLVDFTIWEHLRNQHFGDSLLKILLSYIQTLDPKPIHLDVYPNNAAAVRVYEKNGFHLVSYNAKEDLSMYLWEPKD